MSSALAGRLEVLGAAASFSTGGAAIKATTFTGWQVACFRSGVAALAVLLFLPSSRRGWDRRTAWVGLAYAATLILFVLANKMTTAANAIFLQSTAPFYLLLLGPWLLREPVRRSDLLFMVLVITGITLFFVGDPVPLSTAPEPVQGNVLALLSGVSWALTIAGLRWLERGAVRSGAGMATVAAGNLLACLICLPKALPLGAASPADWGVVVYLGVVQIGLSYVLLTRGVRNIGALETSLLLLLEPALNPVWAWVLHGETPGALAIAGGGLILGCSLVRTLRRG